jgi:ubiquinone/menaquinone biosynthesis C-methylase UbiE
MERIDKEAKLLKGRHMLEIGCGMGYDSLEFLKRGVQVTATDLTPNAVAITRRHFELEKVQAEDIRMANALDLPFRENTFDAVWANGVLHATGDTGRAIQEANRVLKPGGRAIISHFYRKPSWMYLLHHLGRENIEHKEEDPPVNEFYTEQQILSFFQGFEIIEAVREHHRLLPVGAADQNEPIYLRIKTCIQSSARIRCKEVCLQIFRYGDQDLGFPCAEFAVSIVPPASRPKN